MDTVFRIVLSNMAVSLLLSLAAAAAGFRGRRPALAHVLWILVLVKLITPPLVWIDPAAWRSAGSAHATATTSRSSDFTPSRVAAAPSKQGAYQPVLFGSPESERRLRSSLPERPRDLRRTIATGIHSSGRFLTLVLCLAIACLWWTWVARRIAVFLRLLRWARPAPREVQVRAGRLAQMLGLNRLPEVWLVPAQISPLLWSIGMQSRLLLPEALWERLTEDQADTLLVHELAHYRRRDHWVRLLEIAVAGLHWWNPLLWWARRSLRAAEEQCCDAWVVRVFPGHAEAYATAILATVDHLADARDPAPLASTGLTSANELKRRLHRILNGAQSGPISRPLTIVVTGLALVAFALGPTYPGRPYYKATNLDGFGREGLPGHALVATALNDQGQVAGGWANQDPRFLNRTGFQIWHPFRTRIGDAAVTSKTDDLSQLFVEQQRTWVHGMTARLNHRGQMLIEVYGRVDREVGRTPYWQAEIRRGFVIEGHRVLELAPGMHVSPAAINACGQIVGAVRIVQERPVQPGSRPEQPGRLPRTSRAAFRIPPGKTLDVSRDSLGHLGGHHPKLGTYASRATDINTLGQVVGDSLVPGPGPLVAHAFRTAPNEPINPLTDDLGAYGPGLSSSANAINDLGQVAGWIQIPDPQHGFVQHAFRTGPNRPISPLTDDLGTLGGLIELRTGHQQSRRRGGVIGRG